MVARCDRCQVLFDCSAQRGEPRLRSKPELNAPSGVVVEDLANRLKLTYRWYSPKFLFLAFFCLLWDGFLVMWYATIVAAIIYHGFRPELLLPLAFPVLHIALGAALTYWTLAGLFNSTTVEVRSDELTLSHAPLPWPGIKRLDGSQLEQLYCKETISRRKRRRSYHLMAALKDGTRVALAQGFDQPEMPIYVEQQIEKFLNIADRAVDEEFQRH